MSSGAPTTTEVAELRGLVVGREVPEIAHRLAAIRDLIADGGAPCDEDLALVGRMRRRYGRELAELLDPGEMPRVS